MPMHTHTHTHEAHEAHEAQARGPLPCKRVRAALGRAGPALIRPPKVSSSAPSPCAHQASPNATTLFSHSVQFECRRSFFSCARDTSLHRVGAPPRVGRQPRRLPHRRSSPLQSRALGSPTLTQPIRRTDSNPQLACARSEEAVAGRPVGKHNLAS